MRSTTISFVCLLCPYSEAVESHLGDTDNKYADILVSLFGDGQCLKPLYDVKKILAKGVFDLDRFQRQFHELLCEWSEAVLPVSKLAHVYGSSGGNVSDGASSRNLRTMGVEEGGNEANVAAGKELGSSSAPRSGVNLQRPKRSSDVFPPSKRKEGVGVDDDSSGDEGSRDDNAGNKCSGERALKTKKSRKEGSTEQTTLKPCTIILLDDSTEDEKDGEFNGAIEEEEEEKSDEVENLQRKRKALKKQLKDPLDDSIAIGKTATASRTRAFAKDSETSAKNRPAFVKRGNKKSVIKIKFYDSDEECASSDCEDETSESKATLTSPPPRIRKMPPFEAVKSKTTVSNGKRIPFTVAEEVAIMEGVKRYGVGHWSEIKSDPMLCIKLVNRSQVQIKDKHRTMMNRDEDYRKMVENRSVQFVTR